jgi:DNA recombination protein RmuC
MNETVDNKLNDVKLAVENKLKEIQNDNGEKLEKMRQTVDEKLHKTLEERLGQSFKLVSERLEQVHKGLGEMQNLAVGVGDLKKVLSNVRTRGIMGEIQLENILEQILSVEQYERNVCTNPHSRDVVEFAIKLPGKEIDGSIVFLPIDSKFPIEAYYHLQEAYEKANMDEVELARRAIESAIKKSAKDIRDKYIYSPNTTDFGVMFLPIEGLYAEVVRRPQLLEILQREYKIVVTGPTTLAALLNSLQIGFRTLAIEKRSSEVWKILSAVKTEFNKFGVVLEKAQKKITDAGTEIEKLVGTRSKKIIRQLSQVSELKQSEANEILLIETSDDVLEDEEIS